MEPKADTVDILIVDDEANIRFVLSEVFAREGFRTEESRDGQDAVERIQRARYPLVIMDVRMPRMDGITALKRIREMRPETVVLIITAHGNMKLAQEALQLGAYDFFTKPFDLTEVRIVARRAVEKVRLLRQIEDLRRASDNRYQFDTIVGQSAALQEVYQLVKRVLDNDVTVLITGESGTGKEVVASAIHNNSSRRDKPFMKVNMAAIPEALLESEMFGHERGAFTGAVGQKLGKVEAANGGTLFLDEIGDMPLGLQGKMLRVLQEREITRVGSNKSLRVDIRVIAATNRDLQRAVEAGTFREDLYYRLNVIPIHLPPLKKRRDDIPVLIDHFVGVYASRLKRDVRGVMQPAMQRFLDYDWPGNIRELENVVQRCILLASGPYIDVADLPPTLRGGRPASSTEVPVAAASGNSFMHEALSDLDLKELLNPDDFATPLAERLTRISDHMESYLIRAALKRTGGHRQETADLLGISRKSLHNKMVRYGMFGEE